jgi:hypothetical protein
MRKIKSASSTWCTSTSQSYTAGACKVGQVQGQIRANDATIDVVMASTPKFGYV